MNTYPNLQRLASVPEYMIQNRQRQALKHDLEDDLKRALIGLASGGVLIMLGILRAPDLVVGPLLGIIASPGMSIVGVLSIKTAVSLLINTIDEDSRLFGASTC